MAATAKVQVVATLPSLAAIAGEVGGEHVTVTAMAAPSQDPHYVDARPDLVLKLRRADLLLLNGLDLEVGWLPALQTAARNGAIQVGGDGYLDASTVVNRLDVPATRVDRSMGDVHPGGNPHFLFDPRAAASIGKAVGERLARLDPAHADAYGANARRFTKAMLRFAQKETMRFARLPEAQRRVVSYHKSFAYLYDWLGLDEVATVEPKPGIAPSPGHVAKVLEVMRSRAVRVIVQEEFYPRKTSDTLAKLADSQVVVLPGGVDFKAGETYRAHLQQLTEALHGALSKSGGNAD